MMSERTGRAGRSATAAISAAIMAAALALPAWSQGKAGDEPRASGKLAQHSETTYAHELLRLSQTDLIKLNAQMARPETAPMWKAEVVLATFRDIKSRAEQKRATAEYITSMKQYMDTLQTRLTSAGEKEVPDGLWAVGHVKFIFGDLTRSLMTTMEYFGANDKSRAELKPIAELSERVLKVANDGLLAIREAEEKKNKTGDFGEGSLWSQAYAAGAVPEYYKPFSKYYQAMALDPATDSAARKKLLNEGVEALKDWIEGEDAIEKEVKNPALLLRGKLHSEAGRYAEAIRDFAEAQNSKNMAFKPNTEEHQPVPEWIIFQSRYQTVVTNARKQDFDGARRELESLRKTIPADAREGLMAMDMLNFRVAWMEAENRPEAQREAAKVTALQIVAKIVEKDPKSRDLVFEQLVSQTSEADERAGKLAPLQNLALAWNRAQQARTDESRKETLFAETIKFCEQVRAAANATPTEKLEATWLASVANGEIKRYEEAIRAGIAFAEASRPDEPRVKPTMDSVIYYIGQLREISGAAGLSPQVQDLMQKALDIQTGKLKNTAWYYALGLALERKKDLESLKKADDAFSKVPHGDKNYLDAKFHQLRVNALRLEILTNQKAEAAALNSAAQSLLRTCREFSDAVTSSSSQIPKEERERARAEYLLNVKLIEISVLLNPLGKGDEALRAIAELEKSDLAKQLTPAQESGMLRYQILAYQIKKEPAKAIEVVNKFREKFPERSANIMQELVSSTHDEIDTAEKSNNPERAKVLAEQLVGLLGSLLEEVKKKSTPEATKEAYLYRQLQGTMMIKAGNPKGASELFRQLQTEAKKLFEKDPDPSKADDIYNYVQNAKAEKAMGNFGFAQERYGELIPKLRPGGEMWWECYYEMIICNEELMKTDPPARAKERKEQNTRTLKDLRGVHGDEGVGGKHLGDEFRALLKKYGITS